jgi:lipopolysaccharide export LptBFGC system permease protein LptF
VSVVKNTLFALLALVSALVAVFFFYRFQQAAGEGTMNLILGIIFAIVFVGLGIMYMTNKVGKHEDIHITE